MENNKLILFYDGECPVCSREMRYLKKKDRSNLIEFKDITSEDFDPQKYNLTKDRMLKQIHAQMPDGQIITGMEVFRQAYKRVGYGWLLFPTKLPIIKQIADFCYAVFARNRMRISKLLSRCGVDSCSL